MVTDEYFNRVTQALVIRLRQLEDTAEQEGIPTFSTSLLYILYVEVIVWQLRTVIFSL